MFYHLIIYCSTLLGVIILFFFPYLHIFQSAFFYFLSISILQMSKDLYPTTPITEKQRSKQYVLVSFFDESVLKCLIHILNLRKNSSSKSLSTEAEWNHTERTAPLLRRASSGCLPGPSSVSPSKQWGETPSSKGYIPASQCFVGLLVGARKTVARRTIWMAGGQGQEVPEGRNISTEPTDHSCDILANEVANSVFVLKSPSG